MGKLDPKQAENLQNDKVINLDIINRLMKRVEVSSERSVVRDKLTVNKLMSEIHLNQRITDIFIVSSNCICTPHNDLIC
jgi:hypothetical protein